MWQYWIFVYFSLLIGANGKVTDKEYALMPELFYQDNYDQCILYEDEALYCSITYELAPLDPDHTSKTWKIVEEISSDLLNYRHDHLRHGVCVTRSCPKVTQEMKTNTSLVKDHITECYDQKYKHLGLRGTITKIRCETSDPIYPIDYVDIIVAVVLIFYVTLVVYATFYEGLSRYKKQEDYQRTINTKYGKIMAAFSMCRNWERLKTVKETPDVIALRGMQGIRFYNMVIVILVHSAMIIMSGPVSNPKFTENLRDKPANIFLSSGGYAVSTFFLMSGFLLTYHLFLAFDNKKNLNVNYFIMAFVHRYLRLTPALVFVLAIHCTWLRHVSRGPIWDDLIGQEFRRCRKNWWSNLFYINTYVDGKNMCMAHTWYLCNDTHYFILELIILWFILKNKKLVKPIVVGLCIFTSVYIFAAMYINDFDAAVRSYPELLYGMQILQTRIWQVLLPGLVFNFPGMIAGIFYGYLYYTYKDKPFFTSKTQHILWWLSSLFLPLGVIIIPGLIIYNENYQHNIWFSATYVALGKPVFAFSIGYVIFGITKGIGWMTKWICEWSPTYILARLSYSTYLIHVSLSMIRGALRRGSAYASDYMVVCDTLSDLGISLLGATFLTLMVEMPSSELLKLLIPAKGNTSSPKDPEPEENKKKSKIT